MNASSNPTAVRVIDTASGCPELPLVVGKGRARAAIWPGMGASLRSLQLIELAPDARTVDLKHPSDAVYYVVDGRGTIVDTASGETWPLAEGAMAHIDAGDGYRLVAAPSSAMTIIGGPCPADPALYAHLASG